MHWIFLCLFCTWGCSQIIFTDFWSLLPHSPLEYHHLTYILIKLKSKLLMHIQPRRPRTAPNKKLNCTALNSSTTKDNLRRLLARNLDQIPEEPTVWPALRHAIHSAASEALCPSRKRNQDWFDCNSAEIQLLLQSKHQAHPL